MSGEVGRVLFVDDDEGMRKVLERLVDSVGLESTSYGRPSEFLDTYDYTGAGCVVVDVIMPEMTGIQLLRAARDRKIDLPFIVLTGYADVEVAVSAFRAGAFDFLEKPFSDSTFLTMVQRAIEQSRTELGTAAARSAIRRRLDSLSAREREVAAMMIRGLSNKEIARELGISHRTIERHRQCAIRKMGVRSVVELSTILASDSEIRGGLRSPADAPAAANRRRAGNGALRGSGEPNHRSEVIGSALGAKYA